jgi:hypothetical protein
MHQFTCPIIHIFKIHTIASMRRVIQKRFAQLRLDGNV